MECAVFDTWVNKKDGSQMHFDIIVPTNTSHENVLNFGRKYLSQKGQEGQPIHAKNCQFCHIELASTAIENGITQQGYYILEMQGCN